MKRLKKGRARRRREKRRRRLARELCVYLNAAFVRDYDEILRDYVKFTEAASEVVVPGWQPFSVVLHDRP